MKNLTRLFFVFAAVLTLLSFFPATTIAAVPTPELKIEIGNFGSTADFESGYKEGEEVEQCTYGEGRCIEVGWLGQYVNAIFRYGVGLAAILAVVMIMVGGFIWLTSGGSPDKVGRAKEYITSSIVGLLLALFSYVILYTINPRLVANEPLVVQNVEQQNQVCCTNTKTRESSLQYAPNGNCAELNTPDSESTWEDGGDRCGLGCCHFYSTDSKAWVCMKVSEPVCESFKDSSGFGSHFFPTYRGCIPAADFYGSTPLAPKDGYRCVEE